jgi:transcriptional regulator with XRE-family HTH domain
MTRQIGKVIGNRVKTIREAHRISQRELAARVQALGVTIHHPGIGKIEQGKRKLDVSELFAFALALDVSPIHLILPPEAATVDVSDGRQINAYDLSSWMSGKASIEGQNIWRFSEVAAEYATGEAP